MFSNRHSSIWTVYHQATAAAGAALTHILIPWWVIGVEKRGGSKTVKQLAVVATFGARGWPVMVLCSESSQQFKTTTKQPHHVATDNALGWDFIWFSAGKCVDCWLGSCVDSSLAHLSYSCMSCFHTGFCNAFCQALMSYQQQLQ